VLALWWGFNASIPKIIGLGIYSDINPQTLKTIDLITAIDIYLKSLKTQTYPALKDEACPVVILLAGITAAIHSCNGIDREPTLLNPLYLSSRSLRLFRAK
jgi:hypothetical protein